MVMQILKKQAATPEEAKLAMMGMCVEVAQSIRALIDNKGVLTTLGNEAAASNALNEQEIAARNEASEIVENANIILANQLQREAAIDEKEKELAKHLADAKTEVDEFKRAAKEEIDNHAAKADDKHSTANDVLKAAEDKLNEANDLFGQAKIQKEQLDAREADVSAREAHIESVKAKLG